MAVDILGAVFSILSLVFKAKFDVVAAITYILVVVSSISQTLLAVVSQPYVIGVRWRDRNSCSHSKPSRCSAQEERARVERPCGRADEWGFE
jgi:hypothetical protein